MAMDYSSSTDNSFVCKAKAMVSSFFVSLLQASTFQFPMQTQKPQCSLLGLKTIISFDKEEREMAPRVIRSAEVGTIKSMRLTPPSSCSLLDDLIGSESGVCLTSNAEAMEMKSTPPEHYHRNVNHGDQSRQNQRFAAKKQFPPPIPFLGAQSGHGSNRAPWILTRHHTDGRLILKLERVKYHRYLQSYRENDRLILKLVPTPGGNSDEEDDRDLQFIEEDEERDLEEGGELIDDEEEDEEIEEGTESTMAFKSFTYSGKGCNGGMSRDRNLFCGIYGKNEGRQIDCGYFGSAPFCRMPMGTVI